MLLNSWSNKTRHLKTTAALVSVFLCRLPGDHDAHLSSSPCSHLLYLEPLPLYPPLVWLLLGHFRPPSGHIAACAGIPRPCQNYLFLFIFFFFTFYILAEQRPLSARGAKQSRAAKTVKEQRAKTQRREGERKRDSSVRCLATKHDSVQWCWGG